MPLPTNSHDIYADLRNAIDRQDIAAVQVIHRDHPALDWNAVTPNGLSALWWALTPRRRGAFPAASFITFITALLTLQRNGHSTLNDLQPYSGLRPQYYLKKYSVIRGEVSWDDAMNQSVHASLASIVSLSSSTNNIFGTRGEQARAEAYLVADTHSASNPIIVRTADANLLRLHARYHEQLNVDADLKDLEYFIKQSDSCKEWFPSLRRQRDILQHALTRITNDKTLRSVMDSNRGPTTLKAALALAWHAAKDEDPATLPRAATNNTNERKRGLLENLLESQTAYGLNDPSCWLGTWGRIGNALSNLHADVYYQKDEPVVAHEATMQNSHTHETGTPAEMIQSYSCRMGSTLAKLVSDDLPTYWLIIQFLLLEKDHHQKKINDWLTKIYANNIDNIGSIAKSLHHNVEVDLSQRLPLSGHDTSQTLQRIQALYYRKNKSEQFNNIILHVNMHPNKVISVLKERYLKNHMSVPTLISIHPDCDMIKARILETLLKEPAENETPRSEENLFAVESTRLQLKKYPDIAKWYEALPAAQQLTIALDHDFNKTSPSSIAVYALRNNLAEGLSLQGIDLSHADLRGCDLRELDFSGVKLIDADLRLILADGAKWDGCDLTNADFNQWLFPEALLGSTHCKAEHLTRKNFNRETILHTAVSEYKRNAVQAILNSKHCSAELMALQNHNRETALMLATRKGHTDIAKAIIESKHCSAELMAWKKSHMDTDIAVDLITSSLKKKYDDAISALSNPKNPYTPEQARRIKHLIKLAQSARLVSNCEDQVHILDLLEVTQKFVRQEITPEAYHAKIESIAQWKQDWVNPIILAMGAVWFAFCAAFYIYSGMGLPLIAAPLASYISCLGLAVSFAYGARQCGLFAVNSASKVRFPSACEQVERCFQPHEESRLTA